MTEKEWVDFSFVRNGEGCLVCSVDEAAAFVAAGDLTSETRITVFYSAGRKADIAGSLLGSLFSKADQPSQSEVPLASSSAAEEAVAPEPPTSPAQPAPTIHGSHQAAESMKAFEFAPLDASPMPQTSGAVSPLGSPSSSDRPVALFMLIVMGVGVLFAFAMILKTTRPDSAASSEGEVAAEANPNSDLLTFATSREVIGLNPAYLDQRLGVPKIAQQGYRVFEVEGCTISYSSDDSGVRSFEVDVTEQCQPTIDGHKITINTTFGEILGKVNGGYFYAACLQFCGNAADPVLSLIYPGFRANGDIETRYSTDYWQSKLAMDKWGNDIRRAAGLSESESSIDFMLFSCRRDPSNEVQYKMQTMTVRRVRMDHDNRFGC